MHKYLSQLGCTRQTWKIDWKWHYKMDKILSEAFKGIVPTNNIKGWLVQDYTIQSSLKNFNVQSKPVTKAKNILPLLWNWPTLVNTGVPSARKKHVSICKTQTREQSATISSNKIDILTSNFVHLQTARVFITGPTGTTKFTHCLYGWRKSN